MRQLLTGEAMNALVYNSVDGVIYQRSLSELHAHANIAVLDLLADSGGALMYDGTLVFDSSSYYTTTYLDTMEGDIYAAIALKSDLTHNHNLADLDEKSYNSLDNLPDLSDLHAHVNKATLDVIPDYAVATEGDIMERSAAGIAWVAKSTFSYWERIGTVLSPLNDGDTLEVNSIAEEALDAGVDVEGVKHLDSFTEYDEIAEPATPAANKGRVFAEAGTWGTETDSVLKFKDENANVFRLSHKRYVHSEPAPASTWTINHNLGKEPLIQLYDNSCLLYTSPSPRD